MRTVSYLAASSLDGFIADANGGIDWIQSSREGQAMMADYWATIDTLLWGRKTWDMAVAAGRSNDPGFGDLRNYVFSRTLRSIDQPNVELVATDPGAFVHDLKRQPGKGLWVMSGGHFASALFAAGVIDEVGLNIHPVLFGAGVPVVQDPGRRVSLELREARTISGGCVCVTYRVKTSRSSTSSRATSARGQSRARRRGE